MYEDLVKRLRTCGNSLSCNKCKWRPKCDGISDSFRKAADAIEELTDKNVGKWIPVTEALPEKDVPVLVYLFGDSPYIAWINHDGEWETEEFTIDRDYLPKTWMPLPEPPKEE